MCMTNVCKPLSTTKYINTMDQKYWFHRDEAFISWFLFLSQRCLPILLDSFLCPPHNASTLSRVPHPTSPNERGDVAGLCQQRPEPRHIHCLQHWVQELLQKSPPALLLIELPEWTLLRGPFLNAQQLQEMLLTVYILSLVCLCCHGFLPLWGFYFSTFDDSKVCLSFMFHVKKLFS